LLGFRTIAGHLAASSSSHSWSARWVMSRSSSSQCSFQSVRASASGGREIALQTITEWPRVRGKSLRALVLCLLCLLVGRLDSLAAMASTRQTWPGWLALGAAKAIHPQRQKGRSGRLGRRGRATHRHGFQFVDAIRPRPDPTIASLHLVQLLLVQGRVKEEKPTLFPIATTKDILSNAW
jgi:hypothetical protein